MEAAAASGSSGNSRKMKRTLPVSMYFFLSSGYVVSWKWLQCGQVIEAYSTIVTGALSAPWTWSPSGPGVMSSAIGTSVAAPAAG
jgi:hypothetical protein